MRLHTTTVLLRVTLKTRQSDVDTAYDVGQLLTDVTPDDSSWGDPLPYERITEVEYVDTTAMDSALLDLSVALKRIEAARK